MMKRLLLSLLLALCLPSVSHAALKFYWSMENTSPNDLTLSGSLDYSAGADTACTVNGTADVNTTAVLKGTYGLQVLAAGDRCAFDSEAAIHSTSAGTFGLYFRVQTWVNQATLFLVRGSASSNDQIRCELSSNDDITCTIRNTTNATAVSTVALGLTTNTTYFMTYQYSVANSDVRVCVYDSGGSLIGSCGENLSATMYEPANLATAGGFRIGEAQGFGAALYIDNFFYGNSYDDQTAIYNNRNITDYTGWSNGVNLLPRRLRMNQ